MQGFSVPLSAILRLGESTANDAARHSMRDIMPGHDMGTLLADDARNIHQWPRSKTRHMPVWPFDGRLHGGVGERLGDRRMPHNMQNFARIWRAAEKVVDSASKERVSTSRTRLERSFSPELVRAMKTSAERDLMIAGPNLAAHAFQAGLVDECQVFVTPIAVGRGKSPMSRGLAVKLELDEGLRFDNGFVYLR